MSRIVQSWFTCFHGRFIWVAAILIFFTHAIRAQTNAWSDSEIQGRAFVEKILAQAPAENATNSGVLEIRNDNGRRVQIPIEFKILAGQPQWQAVYATRITNGFNGDPTFGRTYFSELTIIHSADRPTVYRVPVVNAPSTETNSFSELKGDQLMTPFAASDFWLADLGLDFFHWPQQKILKKEFHRQCPCTVLESTNPHPGTNSYSRVVAWIDNDSLGIVEANAYDFKGRKLKNFYPKNLEKVNGQYQVQTLIMDNVQTGSRSRLDFDLEK